MKGINIYNRDGKILTAKIINEIGRNLSKSKGRNITFIIQGGAFIKIEEWKLRIINENIALEISYFNAIFFWL